MLLSPDALASAIEGFATVLAAVIVGVFGAMVGRRYARERDRQDKESQWRSHAIELTKLDLERKLRSRSLDATEPLRPGILDFLANYRDLQELGKSSPAELYERIKASRITTSGSKGANQNRARIGWVLCALVLAMSSLLSYRNFRRIHRMSRRA
jgi:hypothetical protein